MNSIPKGKRVDEQFLVRLYIPVVLEEAHSGHLYARFLDDRDDDGHVEVHFAFLDDSLGDVLDVLDDDVLDGALDGAPDAVHADAVHADALDDVLDIVHGDFLDDAVHADVVHDDFLDDVGIDYSALHDLFQSTYHDPHGTHEGGYMFHCRGAENFHTPLYPSANTPVLTVPQVQDDA
jgi:hypothetical protein